MSAYKLNATYQQMQLNMALRFAVVKACAKKDVPCYMVHSPHSPTAPNPPSHSRRHSHPHPSPPQVNMSTWQSHIGGSIPRGTKDGAKKKLVFPRLLSALGLSHDSIPFDMKRHDAADAVAIGLAGLAGKRDGYSKENHRDTIQPRLPAGSSAPPRLGSPSHLEFVESLSGTPP